MTTAPVGRACKRNKVCWSRDSCDLRAPRIHLPLSRMVRREESRRVLLPPEPARLRRSRDLERHEIKRESIQMYGVSGQELQVW